MRWLIIVMLLGAWGCGKSSDAELPAKASFDATKAARSELRVLEEPGLWQMQNTVIDPDGQTNRNTATMQVSWALNGHCLLLETEINMGEQKAHELVVKHYDSGPSHKYGLAGQYQCRWQLDP